MKKRFLGVILFLMVCLFTQAQTVLTYQNQAYNNTATGAWNGVDVPRTVVTTFSFLNNTITSVNTQGYMLQAGDEVVNNNNNHLDGELIQGNKIIWNGNFSGIPGSMVITHGLFTGCNINVNIKHNYLDHVPMGIIRKSASNMSNTSGGVSYNILKTFNVGGVVKGMSNVNWYNNTFYNDRPTYSSSDPTIGTWRGCIDVYTNTDVTPNSVSHGTKIKNNIFYSKYKTCAVNVMDAESLVGLECDYNVYWCEEGDHTPVFNAGGTTKTWDQWRAMGYDAHSVVINPNFNNFTDFVPASRLNYGTDLGSAFNTGLSTIATWTVGSSPATQTQNGTWQVGARIYAASIPVVVPTVTTTAISSITQTTAISGGNVTSNGGGTVTERGVCWNQTGSPALDNLHTHDGSTTGTFTSNITGLLPNTTYYVRAYATNSAGTGYGEIRSFKTASTPVTQKTYYVGQDGNDATGDGSYSKPWATIKYASTRATAIGDTIYILPGSITDPQQILLANGVNLIGGGRTTTTVVLTQNSTYPCIKLETPNGWGNLNYGNQTIAGIKFVGNLTGITAIGVNFRSNVNVHDCEFVGFLDQAIFYNGQPSYEWTRDNPYNNNPNSDYPNMPDTNGWCYGNKFNYNIVTNCSKTLSYSATGSICVGTQDGFEMRGNIINSETRNGFGIKFWDLGFNRNSDIHDNDVTTFTKGSGGNPFEFAIEWWWGFGGDRFYNNRIRGALDMVNMVDDGNYGYSARIHGNDIGRDEIPSVLERGILLEGRCEKIDIYQNHIHHVAIAFYIPRNNYTSVDRLFYINIYDNLCVKLGQTGTNWQTWGIYYPDFEDEAEHQYIRIQHNIFEADNSLTTISMFGIQLPNVTKQSYIYVENNIILNFDYSSISATTARTKADYIFVRNNLSFNNGNSNQPLFDADFRNSLTNYTESGTVIASPGFKSSTDYHLNEESPAIGKGIKTTITFDYDNNMWNDPPSIGAYENNLTPYHQVIVSNGFRIKSDINDVTTNIK